MEIDQAPEVRPDLGDAPTRERVVRSILENGPSTAAALGERLELTPAAVRRHLDHLLDQGAIEAREPRAATGRGRGRPAKIFALTEGGHARFDQQYDDLAVQALRFLSETGGDAAVKAFAERRVAFIEDQLPGVLATDPSLSPAQALATVFTAQGYAASVRGLPLVNEQSVGEQLCQQHCPVSHVAHEFPQLCEAETEAISRALGSHVQRLATIAHGDGVCTTCIPQTRVSTGSTTEHGSTTEQVSTGSTTGWVSTGSTTERGSTIDTGSTTHQDSTTDQERKVAP